jgi:hypothetical protein
MQAKGRVEQKPPARAHRLHDILAYEEEVIEA